MSSGWKCIPTAPGGVPRCSALSGRPRAGAVLAHQGSQGRCIGKEGLRQSGPSPGGQLRSDSPAAGNDLGAGLEGAPRAESRSLRETDRARFRVDLVEDLAEQRQEFQCALATELVAVEDPDPRRFGQRRDDPAEELKGDRDSAKQAEEIGTGLLLGQLKSCLTSEASELLVVEVAPGRGLADVEAPRRLGQALLDHGGTWWPTLPMPRAGGTGPASTGPCARWPSRIDNLGGAVAAVTAGLLPGAWWAVSLVHPCFPGSKRGLSSWPAEAGYEAEGWWHSVAHNPDGARIRVGSFHRRLSTYLNAFLGSGLVLERVTEPPRGLPELLTLAWRKPDRAERRPA